MYLRVSSLRQVEGDSLEAQQNAIVRYIETQKDIHGWKVESVTHYEEPGRSAKDMKRPVLQRLMQDIRQGRIDTVIAFKLDRISRNVSDS